VTGETLPTFRAALREQYAEVCDPALVRSGYFCALYARRATVAVASSKAVHFPSSAMGRHYIHAQLRLAAADGQTFHCLTSHMESMADSRAERMAQFAELLRQMRTVGAAGAPCVLMGDTNLREAEVRAAAEQLRGVSDAWDVDGAAAAKRFTWDLERNTNLQMGGGVRPRARYDRVFYTADAMAAAGWRQRRFELVGTERAETRAGIMFPSDHFGVLCEFARDSG
jgi:tyrosyl-DNA phosphodiesterase 2